MAPGSGILPDVDRLLRDRFGFDSFRPGQREAICVLLRDRRVLSVQPTGHGKSLLYQLPALCVDGMTLVISPLLALVRDQIRQLRERFGIAAAAINSDQTDDENRAACEEARAGRVTILFVAPERLDSLLTYRFLLSLPVALLVVDEAHCISTWGHDFRPSYRRIVDAVRAFCLRRAEAHGAGASGSGGDGSGDLRVLGLTATADRRTEADIAAQLGAASGAPLRVLRSAMDRPNLALAVVPVDGAVEKLEALYDVVEGAATAGELSGGIVYCATRDRTELAAQYLRACGVAAVAYHAGLPPADKRRLQDEFIAGTHRAICATNALGMGIDKPDVRFVMHFDVPGSITAYYQEVGRAGRDGLPARGVLLFDEDDRRIQEHFIHSAQPLRADFDAVADVLRDPGADGPPGLTTVKIRTGLHPTRVTVVLAELLEQGYADKVLVGRRQAYTWMNRPGVPRLERYERRHEVRTRELEAMFGYARGAGGCLMRTLRRALGDESAAACGRCGVCRSDVVAPPGPGDHHAQVAGAAAGVGVGAAGANGGARGACRVDAASFLDRRSVPLSATRAPRMSAGLAVLDGELRSPLHIEFLRCRSDPERGAVPPDLLRSILDRVNGLVGLPTDDGPRRFGAVVAVPSRTWTQRVSLVEAVARELGCLAFPDLLVFGPEPLHRQADLRNNDQRRENVRNCIRVQGEFGSTVTGPARRAVLLIDDFIGSGATLREAARALRARAGVGHPGVRGEIVPLAVTRVRWRLGAKGFV